MAVYQVICALLFALALSKIGFSTCHVLKGSVTCLDCDSRNDLSGIKILVKCNKVKKLAMATTQGRGLFETELPSDTPTSSPSPNCQAMILGGPQQLYTSTKNTVSTIVMADNSYTISQPLSFYTSCPLEQKDGNCGASGSNIGSSKTIDLPLPREWGLAPSSYYVPFIPIIGIP